MRAACVFTQLLAIAGVRSKRDSDDQDPASSRRSVGHAAAAAAGVVLGAVITKMTGQRKT